MGRIEGDEWISQKNLFFLYKCFSLPQFFSSILFLSMEEREGAGKVWRGMYL